MSTKRVLIFTDSHCGHRVGLTPPRLDTGGENDKFKKQRAALWKAYATQLAALAPIHYTLYLGDGIDGTGHRSHGTELLTTDRLKQVDMAVECLDHIRLHAATGYKMAGVYGTPYHTGEGEDYEDLIAKRAGFEKIGAHEWININGVIFDIAHKVGGSTIPHGVHTAPAKEGLQNREWAVDGGQPLADILVRGHVHRWSVSGTKLQTQYTAPGLQGFGSKYGGRQCRGRVDWGLMWFDVRDDGKVFEDHYIPQLPQHKAKTIVL